MGCVYQDSYPRKYILREKENWIKTRRQILQEHLAPKKKLGKERVGPSRGFIQKCEPHERGPCAPKFGERSHEETLHQEECARKAAWDLAKKYKLKNADKATFHSSNGDRENKEMIMAPSYASKSPEEREFVADSGASMHMMPETPLWCSRPMEKCKQTRKHESGIKLKEAQ